MAYMDFAVSILASVQTEICIFLFAVIAHALFFGRYRVGGGVKTRKDQSTKEPRSKGERSSLSERSPKAVQAASSTVKALRPLLREGASVQTIGQQIEEHLKDLDIDSIMEILSGIIEGMGKSVTKEVIGAVRVALKKRQDQTDPGMATWFLRGYLSLRLFDDFAEVLAEVEEQGPLPPNITMLAFRAAVAADDLDLVLKRIGDLAPVWKATGAVSASAAPQQTLARAARLAAEKGALKALLGELAACGLVLGWTLEAVLLECIQGGQGALLKEIRELAAEHGADLTPAAYAALLRAEPAGALGILQEAVSKKLVGEDLLIAGAEAAMAGRDETLAAAVVQQIPKGPSTELAAHAIQLCGPDGPLAGGDSEAAVLRVHRERLQEAELLPDTRAAKAVAEAAIRKGKAQEVLARLCSEPGDEVLQSVRRVALLKSLSPDVRLAGAQAIFNSTEDKTACLYNALIDTCIHARDLPAAEKAMNEASSLGLADVVTYNTIIKAHLQTGDARKARMFFEKMSAAGHCPNIVTYNELLDSIVRKDVHGAWQLVEEMKSNGVQPNHVTCSIMLKSVQPGVRMVDVERTMKLLDHMDDEMDEVLLSSVCEACIRVGRADLLQKQLKRQKGESGLHVQGAHTYGSIIRAHGYVQDLDGVWSNWREMKRRNIVPTAVTLGCMVEALVTNHEVEAAHKLICEAVADPELHDMVNAVIYCSVLKGFIHEKRFDRVWSVHKEMVKLELQFSAVTYNTLIDACARSQEMFRIPALLKEMDRQGIEPTVITYSTILKGYCMEHKLEKPSRCWRT